MAQSSIPSSLLSTRMKQIRSRTDSGSLPPPTFDLDVWAANYEGALLPLRLAHVAIRCPPLARQALKLAVAAAKKSKNVQTYLRVCELAAHSRFTDLSTPDADWIAKQEEGNKRELARLEGELRGYKNNLIRESIRMGQEDLAQHHLDTGGPLPDPNNPQSFNTAGYNAAYQAFGKMRDYCTTPTHVAAMTLRLTYTAVLQAVTTQQTAGAAMHHYNSVLANATRLRNIGVKEEEQVKLTPIALAMSGIAQLGQGNYREAALSFRATPYEYNSLGSVHGADFGRLVASANDLAVYGGLCCLATHNRQELNDNVLGGPFRGFLELEPHVRKAISLFTTAKYQACLDTLQRYYSDWSLDVFLGAPTARGSHVDRLFELIREKSITAYCASFSEVSLASLAQTFPPTTYAPLAMEEEVLGMIDNGRLHARLDAVSGVLVAPKKNIRANTQAEAQRTAEEVERTLLLRLHKVNAALAALEIPRPRQMQNPAWGDLQQIMQGSGAY